MFSVKSNGSHAHKWFVDSETRDEVCLCGATKGQEEKGRKYHNRSSEYGGYIYQSQFEMRYAVELDLRLRAKQIKSWERQVKLEFAICPDCARLNDGKCTEHPAVKQFHITNYYVDFKVFHNDETIEYVECKGMETPEWKLKWKLTEVLYGNRDDIALTVVKEKSTWSGIRNKGREQKAA